MKTLGICGDSFMSQVAVENLKDNGFGKHFVDDLKIKLGCGVINFARGGCSNTAIRLQIDEIIKCDVDYVIIGLTSPDRMEIPIKGKRFIISNGLSNISHKNFPDLSGTYDLFKTSIPTTNSFTLSNVFIGANNDKFDEDIVQLLKDYFLKVYDQNYKKLLDSWVISDGLNELNKHGIKYSVINTSLDRDIIKSNAYDYISESSELNPWNYYNENEKLGYLFHISHENSLKLSELWYNKIKKYFL